MEDCKDLSKIKEEYENLRKKYNLPEFDSLAEEFDIEKIAEKESSFVLRDIRRVINEKISAYLHLFEIFMNPASPPMLIFSMLKNAKEEDRKSIRDIYKRLARLEIEMMKLDTVYEEGKEADFINKSYGEWQDIKKDVYSLLERFDKSIDENNNSSRKGYFG